MSLTADEWSCVWISLKIATVAVILSLPFAVAVGYWLARHSGPLRGAAEMLLNLPLVLPPLVTGYILLYIFGRRGPVGGWLDETFGFRIAFTWIGAVVAGAVVGFPLMVRAIRLAFQSVDPRLELAARTLGAGRMAAFFSVSLPLARRGMIAGAVLAFARCLGEFGATIMLAGNIEGETRTLPMAIYSLAQRPGGFERAWPLVWIAIALACLALAASEYLERRGKRV